LNGPPRPPPIGVQKKRSFGTQNEISERVKKDGEWKPPEKNKESQKLGKKISTTKRIVRIRRERS